MAPRQTDKQKKQIIADYVELENYSAVGRMHGVSDVTVRNIVKADKKTSEKIERKKEENTRDVLAFMETRRDKVCEIIDLGLELLPEKLKGANAVQIATVLGIIIDKFTMSGTMRAGLETEEDPLTRSLREEAERLNDADK